MVTAMTASAAKPDIAPLTAAGLSADAVKRWAKSQPAQAKGFAADGKRFSVFWQASSRLLEQLPKPPQRSEREREVARIIQDAARRSRVEFLRQHADALYDALTSRRSRFLRIEEIAVAAAKRLPGLVPSPKEIAAEEGTLQRDKAGLEIDQGLLISALLGSERSGTHLCHAMLLAREASIDLLPKFIKDGKVDLPGGSIERRGKAAILTYKNLRFLNAEDQTTLDGFETCVDLALLDARIEIAVLRGGPVEHPKYAGRRVFGSGINLTHLYHGRIPFLWYLTRDLGYVNKLYRGLAVPHDAAPDEYGGQTLEKPWIAAVESFAIGGHCQVLLAVDYVLAERNAFMTLPARK